MSFQIFFTLDEATRLIGLKPKDKWRVIKFAQGKEYGLDPSVRKASGSGSRRLYSLTNVCELALALRLLETGLRSMAIGKVIKQLREKGPRDLVSITNLVGGGDSKLQLAIMRTPQTGKPLNEKREQVVEWVRTIEEAERIRRENPNSDLIMVPVGLLFSEFNQRLRANLSGKA